MAPFFFLFLFLFLLLPTSLSRPCDSRRFATTNKTFAACTDLPHLAATLHWTYHRPSSALSIAFTAAPPTPAGWVAWALNPSAPAMPGSQALLAYSSPAGNIVVATYDVRSYSELVQGPLSFNVSKISAESSSGKITIFATWQLPMEGVASLNQVWQVGPSVTGGRPDRHEAAVENLAAKQRLDLAAEIGAPWTSKAAEPPPSEAPAPAAEGNPASEGTMSHGVCLALLLLTLGLLLWA